MNAISCAACGSEFQPKPGGYNALYCTIICKIRAHRARLQKVAPEKLVDLRRRSYEATKAHPDRLAKHRRSGRNTRQLGRAWLSAYKMERGCVDCGYRLHPAALQLDHEGTKSVSISEARSSIARLQKEIEAGECKVRCANCHAIRTSERRQALMADNDNAALEVEAP